MGNDKVKAFLCTAPMHRARLEGGKPNAKKISGL
jgi:hypothetical protein